MRNLCTVFLIFAVTITGYSQTRQPQATQPPAGPTLDFTLNYINSALSRGTVSLSGKYGTVLTWSYEDRMFNGVWRQDSTIDLLSADPHPFGDCISCPKDNQGNLTNCMLFQGTVVAETNASQSLGIHVGTKDRAWFRGTLEFQVREFQNPYKLQDFTNALTHLIALVRYQYQTERKSELQQQQQQNQGDPFAKPQ